jgi:hypothetical protein
VNAHNTIALFGLKRKWKKVCVRSEIKNNNNKVRETPSFRPKNLKLETSRRRKQRGNEKITRKSVSDTAIEATEE